MICIGNIVRHDTGAPTKWICVSEVVERDQRLDQRAKKMHSDLSNYADTWECSIAGLAKVYKEGKCAIRAAINALEDHGYLRREQIRDLHGKYTREIYHIYDQPQPDLQAGVSVDPDPVSPLSDNRTQNIINTDISIVYPKYVASDNQTAEIDNRIMEIHEAYPRHRRVPLHQLRGLIRELGLTVTDLEQMAKNIQGWHRSKQWQADCILRLDRWICSENWRCVPPDVAALERRELSPDEMEAINRVMLDPEY